MAVITNIPLSIWQPFRPDFRGPQPDLFTPVQPEASVGLPWQIDPRSSWWTYQCRVEVYLDAGMALHKPLPQSNPDVDTLASVFIDDPTTLEKSTDGVNLETDSPAVDVIQRMASSTFLFVIKGFAVRAGHRIPVPGIRGLSVGSGALIPLTPGEVQWSSGNYLIGNLSGVPLWRCEWELHYYCTSLLFGSGSQPALEPTPPNPALRIRGDAELPVSVALPTSTPDSRAVLTPIINAF